MRVLGYMRVLSVLEGFEVFLRVFETFKNVVTIDSIVTWVCAVIFFTIAWFAYSYFLGYEQCNCLLFCFRVKSFFNECNLECFIVVSVVYNLVSIRRPKHSNELLIDKYLNIEVRFNSVDKITGIYWLLN